MGTDSHCTTTRETEEAVPISMSWSPEMTFIPRAHPHEITDRRAGERLVKRVQTWLSRLYKDTNLCLRAKLDPFHLNEDWKPQTWCVEVVPLLTHFRTDWLYQGDESHAPFMEAIDSVFAAMKDRFGLVPSVSRTVKRGGETVRQEFPGGGCHVHLGADLFRYSPGWYAQMERFHRNLVTDYANRPYIRWLLAQWSDDVNSRCLITEEDFPAPAKRPAGWTTPITEETAWARSFGGTHAIEPRWMETNKDSHLTFELRFINMVENAAELRAVAFILAHWMEHIRDLSHAGTVVDLTISRRDLRAMRDLRERQGGANSIVHSWLDSIITSASLCSDLRPIVDTLFQRNYRNRVLYGRMV